MSAPTYDDLDELPIDMATAETSGLAIVAMLFAVLLGCVPILGQVISLIFAWRARVDVRRSEGYVRGAELARAAEIVSVSFLLVYLFLFAVYVVAYLVLLSV